MKKIYFIMALGLATLSGCSDFLDQNNKSNVPSAEFYQTSAGFASLTNSAYSTLRELYNAQPQLFVAGTDLYADGKSQGVVMSQYTFTADEGIIGEFYQFNLSSCIRQQNSLTAQFVSFSLSNLANIFYPPQFLQ